MAVDPVRGVRECYEMSQMRAETKILIYNLVSVAKIYVLSLQNKLKTYRELKQTTLNGLEISLKFKKLRNALMINSTHSYNHTLRLPGLPAPAPASL